MPIQIVVAGASGNVGSAAVRKLAELGNCGVKALTSQADEGVDLCYYSAYGKIEPLKQLANVEIVECDVNDAASLANVFEGATAVFLTSGNYHGKVQAEKNVIDSAVAAGCKYLVKLGTVASYTALDSEVQYVRFHAEIEEYLKATAGEMKWTVLCPNWLMSNHLGDIFSPSPFFIPFAHSGVVVYPVGVDAKVSMVDPRDVGDLAAAMPLMPDPSTYHGLKLDVSGPEEVCMSEIAALYTEALGRPIAAAKCTIEDWIAGVIARGLPEWLAIDVSKNFSRWDASNMAFPNSPAVMALAPPQRTMAQWVSEWAPPSGSPWVKDPSVTNASPPKAVPITSTTSPISDMLKAMELMEKNFNTLLNDSVIPAPLYARGAQPGGTFESEVPLLLMPSRFSLPRRETRIS
jgi:uncharacterized protein YbjT (DUF2867 family)